MNKITSYYEKLSYPRLAVLILIGLATMVIGGIFVGIGEFTDSDLESLTTPLIFIGFVIFLFGGTGYISFWIFSRRY